MDMNEFNATAVRTADATTITLDVRPFGDRQGEAVDSYLHERVMHLNTTGIGTTPKPVVLLCDSSAQIPSSAFTWLANLNAGGQATEIRQA